MLLIVCFFFLWPLPYKPTPGCPGHIKYAAYQTGHLSSSWCEVGIKLIGMQAAAAASGDTGAVWCRRASTSLCNIAGRSSSATEPSRWWTYAALMHVIITFISWRWHMTSSGPRALWGARKKKKKKATLFLFEHGSRLMMGGIVSNYNLSSSPPPQASPLHLGALR